MKKFDFKTRLQWGWFQSALIGTALAIMIAPTAGGMLGISNTEREDRENPIISMLSSISFGDKVKVIINGDVVALAKSKEAGEEAFKAARLAYNADGVKVLDIDVSFEEVDKEKDAKAIKDMRLLRNERLSEAILDSFRKYAENEKELAYTMRIDDYIVTVDSMEDLISILEKAQDTYDAEDVFKVGLQPTASRNVTMYEVNVTGKAAKENEAATEETSAEEGTAIPIEENKKILLTGAESTTEGANAPEEESQTTTEGETSVPEEGETSTGASEEGQAGKEAPEASETLSQAANDGIKYVGFSETIQVVETYVNREQIKDKDTAYNEMTAKNAEASIYVVEPGDCLSIIAEKNNLSVEEIKELNPDIESDDDIYYDDRLNITVPTAAVQILVEKQETYQENYNEDIVYQDDDSMFIGETEVVQEGTPGTHTVTDLVTYKDDVECDREQLQETVEVAAVAQVVRRGTKSKPTYMFPVTNWNVTSNFGYRWGRLHAGTDVGVPTGTTVRASS